MEKFKGSKKILKTISFTFMCDKKKTKKNVMVRNILIGQNTNISVILSGKDFPCFARVDTLKSRTMFYILFCLKLIFRKWLQQCVRF